MQDVGILKQIPILSDDDYSILLCVLSIIIWNVTYWFENFIRKLTSCSYIFCTARYPYNYTNTGVTSFF